MNLLSLLTNSMDNSDVTGALSNNTRLSSGVVGKLIALALPLLLRKLTANASTPTGAQSLFNALQQHRTDRSLTDQLNNVDTEDGAKIIGHILGQDAESEIGTLAEKAGISSSEATSFLSNIAPMLMSNLSSAVDNGLPQAEEKQESAGGLLGAIGKLFGGGEEDTSAFDGTSLLNMLSNLK